MCSWAYSLLSTFWNPLEERELFFFHFFICLLLLVSYMVTAVQNIERHFQIPSKLSGFLVSARKSRFFANSNLILDDISYVITVIPISYYGSRGFVRVYFLFFNH